MLRVALHWLNVLACAANVSMFAAHHHPLNAACAVLNAFGALSLLRDPSA